MGGRAAAIKETDQCTSGSRTAGVDQDRAKGVRYKHFAGKIAADEKMRDSGRRWIELKFPGAVTNLHFVRRSDDTPGADPVLVLVDDDVEATIAALKARGVEIITEPQEAPWQPGRTGAEFRDSEGNRMVIGSQ
ncbi:VOC family protein [Mesorhizobium ventifaucium]|uniref:VOC family protein n=1 Tax=Mesorhizobium ventifaucium TaxID=666020 RepID=UPI0020A7D8C8|nr:VOC family protein [Mesorhizobium ventifaucium]